jgi:hypothetical protein
MGSFVENLKRLFVKRNHLKCHLCGEAFATSEEFDNHMKAAHK